MPKASAPEFHQSNGPRPNGPLLALRKLLRHRRSPADCFGANPVASALGNSARRDPSEAVRTYHEDRKTNPKTGTFYLAGNRNFLFGSDTLPARAEIPPDRPCQIDPAGSGWLAYFVGEAHLYSASWKAIYFEPLIAALKSVAWDDMGREALKAGLRRVVIDSSSGWAGGKTVSKLLSGQPGQA